MTTRKHSVSSGARFFLIELAILAINESLNRDNYPFSNDEDEDTISVNLNWNGVMNFNNN
jgi:hypothetical protein